MKTETLKPFKPQENKPEHVIVSYLAQRIANLPKESLEALAKLMPELAECDDEYTFREIGETMKEILFPELIGELILGRAGSAEPTESVRRRRDLIGGKIKSLRQSRGLTQEALAERSGLPQSHISRIESGQHSPSQKTLEKLTSALDVKIGDIDPARP